jgi:hypothetical protein
MAEQRVHLVPSRQVRVAGLRVGLVALNPDAAAAQAVIGVYNPDKGQPESHRVRPGDEFVVADRTFVVSGVAPDPAHVDLVVRWADDPT